MIMVSDTKEQEMHGMLSHYVMEVNKYRLQCNYNMANDYLDMLLGALCMYNIVAFDPLDVIERNGEVELVQRHARR